MTTQSPTRLPRLRLGQGMPDVSRLHRSRVSLVYLDRGAPVFHADPITGDPVTVVLLWPTDAEGQLLIDDLHNVSAARWRVDPTAWAALERLLEYGFDLTCCDLWLDPVAPGRMDVAPTWHRVADAMRIDTVSIVDRAIATLREGLERTPNRPTDEAGF